MKQVILEYAGAVIAVLGAISFLVVFHHFFVGRDGVLAQMLVYSIGESSIAENQSFDSYQKKSPPVIVQKEGAFVIAGEITDLSSCFEAKEEHGRKVFVYATGAWDENGNEIDLEISRDRRSICAPEAGVYWIQLSARDSEGKETSQIAKLLVNER